ncbi:MAG TPA: alkaline phosphatase [Saprospiraceae bacterium]|nr:alkaline phosphatase [Saprospiraceae bacterium]
MLIRKLSQPSSFGVYLLALLMLMINMEGCTPKMQPTSPPPATHSPPTKIEQQAPVEKVNAKNIILLIGDGMGLAQITGGMYLNKNNTALEKFPVVGLHKSHSSDNLITDSASGATAFSIGEKSFNGAIGVAADGKPKETILEEAEKRGLATGMLATSSIVHATPAAFIAHVPDRRQYEDIALYFLRTPIDIFIGGGRSYFTRREDGRDLYQELQGKGYVIADYLGQSIAQVDISTDLNFAYFTADKEPLPVLSGRDYFVPATHKILDYLSHRGDNGFFLMIEGSQIDWGGHANDAKYVLSEFKEFNIVIDICFEFAKRKGNTLVVVTADHETGGFTIIPESTMNELKVSFSTGDHTAVMIPVFAYGPGSDRFAGIYENNTIFRKMREAYGWSK